MKTPYLTYKMEEIDAAIAEIKDLLGKTDDTHYYVGFLFGTLQRLALTLRATIDEAKNLATNEAKSNQGAFTELELR